MPGRYIVIEGNDGTGKSTQVQMFADHLTSLGQEVVIVEEPGSEDPTKTTPVANELRRVIKDGRLERAGEINLVLFAMARRELWQQLIAPALNRGATVVSSRNYVSTLAYQGRGEGVSETEILRLTELFTDAHYLDPDLTIILDLSSTAERERRIAKRGDLEAPDTFESRDHDFQVRVNAAYHDIAVERGYPMIDCTADDGHHKTIEEIQTEIRVLTGTVRNNPIDRV